MAIKILFHSYGNGRHCPDGFGAAYAAWKRYGDDAEYIPCVYSQPAPSVQEGDTIFVLDFSYPRELLEQWSRVAYVIVLDHHKTALETLKDLRFAHFDMQRSGAQLAWEFFSFMGSLAFSQPPIYSAQLAWEWWNPHSKIGNLQEAPALIEYIADRDLWRKELPHTEEIHRALATFPMDFHVWDTLAHLPNYVDFMRRIGTPLYQEHLLAVERVVAGAKQIAFDRALGSYNTLATNTNNYAVVSDALNALCKRHPEIDFAYNWFDSGESTKYDLRSTGDFDVSEIAKQYGGGGHKNAAGFSVPSVHVSRRDGLPLSSALQMEILKASVQKDSSEIG